MTQPAAVAAVVVGVPDAAASQAVEAGSKEAAELRSLVNASSIILDLGVILVEKGKE